MRLISINNTIYKDRKSILHLPSILFLLFLTFISSSRGSDSTSDDSDDCYIAGNHWAEKIKDAEDILDILKISNVEKDETYRQEIETHFFNYLAWYKNLDFSISPDKELEMATKLRTYETKLSSCYNGIQLNPKNLWVGEKNLDYIEIRNMSDLKLAILKGAPKPNPEMINFINNGGSTGFPLNHHLPPRFFRLPSNFMGQRFLIGGERTKVDEYQEDYMLNYAHRFYPDILGDARSLASYVCIPDNKFYAVEFDFIDNRILKDMIILEECKRILKIGGTFIYRTQRDSIDAYKAISSEIQAGFFNLKNIFLDVKFEFKTDENWTSQIQNKYWIFIARKH